MPVLAPVAPVAPAVPGARAAPEEPGAPEEPVGQEAPEAPAAREAAGAGGGGGGGDGITSERKYQFSPAPVASAAYSRYSKAPASTWPAPPSAKAFLVVCAVVVAPLSAVITSMPLPTVWPPRPPRFVICRVVLPLATAVGPLSTRRSEGPLAPSTVPRRSVPLLPT